MRWILIVSIAAALAIRGLAATDAQCSGILQLSLDARNPETRKQAVVALSLASGRGPLFDRLEQMLQDKDVEVRQAVVASLADVKSESATAALHKALEDAVPEVSFAAAKHCGPAMTPLVGPRCWRFSKGKARAHPVFSPNRNAMPCA